MTESCILNGNELSPATHAGLQPRDEAEAAALDFCREWFSPGETMQLHTSGSTGKPKTICATKAAMRASARRSCEFFGLTHGSTAVLPLPLDYIAGKMMMVRALVAGLDLRVVHPTSEIFDKLDTLPPSHHHPDFMPVVPMQIQRILPRPDAAALLSRVRCLLIGGAFIDVAIEQVLADLPTRAYVSYGMTETLSHIALRRINGPQRSDLYTPLRGISTSLSESGTLTISVPDQSIDQLITNDLAELLPDGRFRILGRIDAVINSGGIKIQAEKLERQLKQATGLTAVAVGTPHPLLGECVTLLWESTHPETERERIGQICATLPPYERPKRLIAAGELPRTSSGKIARAACRELALQKLSTPEPRIPPSAIRPPG